MKEMIVTKTEVERQLALRQNVKWKDLPHWLKEPRDMREWHLAIAFLVRDYPDIRPLWNMGVLCGWWVDGWEDIPFDESNLI